MRNKKANGCGIHVLIFVVGHIVGCGRACEAARDHPFEASEYWFLELMQADYRVAIFHGIQRGSIATRFELDRKKTFIDRNK
jgi:hypothetical protein